MTSSPEAPYYPELAGILLAAGSSRRFGGDQPKQLLTIAGEPLIRRSARVAIQAGLGCLVAVVAGEESNMGDDVTHALEGLNIQVVPNPRHRQGQASSIRRGLMNLLATEPTPPQGCLFLPADQPFLTERLIRRLLETFAGPTSIVLPEANGRRGAPVLFGRDYFPLLEELRGDRGGRSLLPGLAQHIRVVETPDPLELFDIDTPEDYRRAIREMAERTDRGS